MVGTEKQQEAITTHDRSLVVTAGAGTGKTHVLVNKYVNLLETFGEKKQRVIPLSVQNILALTFTDKAAAEMKERIRRTLDEKEGNFWERTRAEFLIAPVQTFHSFCAQVLREFAFEAEIEPSFVVLDKRESARILSACYEDLIHTPLPGEEGEGIIHALAIVGPYNLEQMLRILYTRREDAEKFFARFREDPDIVIQQWQEEVRRFREERIQEIRTDPEFPALVQSLISFGSGRVDPDDKVMIYLEDVRPFLFAMLSGETTDTFLEGAKSYLSRKMGAVGSKKVWGEQGLADIKETYKRLNGKLKDTGALNRMIIDPEDPFHIQSLRFLQSLGITFDQYCALVDQEKTTSGGMDFSDLIRYTRFLFKNKRDLVARHYADKFRFILIDEFQDTDPAQFEIVTTIIGEPGPQVQSLFIVGDPKQSIYLFREADVTRFRDAQELITNGCGGKEISLDICFRSTPAVISLVNILFSRLFAPTEKPWTFPYNSIRVSDDRSGHAGTVSLLLNRKESGITEPQAVADRIEEIMKDGTEVYEEGERSSEGNRTFRQRPVTFGDIAILLERRTNLGHYLHALAAKNIPYYVHQGTGFYNRQEILDLINLLKFLQKPYDDIPLFGLLRSPYFGISDTDLCKIRLIHGRTFFDKLNKYGEEFQAIERVSDILRTWLEIVPRIRLVAFIRLVLNESGVLAVYAGMLEGEQILSNIEKMLDIIRSREDRGRYQLADLVEDLATSLESEDQEAEAMIIDPDLNAVTIMTVHAAKGLEFPVVFVPEMAKSPNMQGPPIIMDTSGELIGIRLPDPEENFKTIESPVYTLIKREQREKLLAEKRRLLYVALTRSSDHLIMSGEIGDELPDGSKETRLDWIIPALGVTGEAIASGRINLVSEGREQVSLILVTPESKDTIGTPTHPPFEIVDKYHKMKGKFHQNELQRVPSDIKSLAVTKIAEKLNKNEQKTDGDADGEGRDFGTAIHEVLRGRSPASVIRELGICSEDQKKQLEVIQEQFWALPELCGFQKEKREIGFTVVIRGIPVTGRIDLIVQLKDGSWMVIDYKSDLLPGSILKEKKSYQFQLEIYRRVAEIFGMKPAQAALYSVKEQKLILMEPEGEREFADELAYVSQNIPD